MALLGITCEMIRADFEKPAPIWSPCGWATKNQLFLETECNQPSDFDPTHVRKRMVQYITRDENTVVRTCPYGTIHVIYENESQKSDIPWALWGRILRLYGGGKPFTVYFLAASHLRRFPGIGEEITPHHINGGYTYSCNHDTIIIYRAEDATRVLIHELQHSSCLDDHTLGVDQVEAETEAWAELIYCALLARGVQRDAQRMVQRQSAWMRSQNKVVAMRNGHTQRFPWRYTVGKEAVWRRWGLFSAVGRIDVHGSLRLTAPPKADIARMFGVSPRSTIL